MGTDGQARGASKEREVNLLSFPRRNDNDLALFPCHLKTTFPISVLLDNVRSSYNVGSFFRTCDGAGISKLYLTGYTPHPPRRDITKTALGAEASVPFEHAPDPMPVIDRLKAQGVAIVAVETGVQSVPFADFSYPFPCCLVFGNEVEGIRDELLAQCDARVAIPMRGIKGSLNVVVSAGIVLYDAAEKYLRA